VSATAPPDGPILVTGAAGFVGAYLVELLAAEGAEVVGWQRPGTTPLTDARIRWTEVELMDALAVQRALGDLRPAAIYHLAGSAHVADSWLHTRETFEGNVLAAHHVIQGLLRHGLRPRILLSGSATIYKADPEPLTEESALGPSSPYGVSKLAQELVGAQAWTEHQIPVLLARSFNHVGPRQTPAYVAPAIARQIALIERGDLPPVLRMGNLDPARDVMDVRDTVRAYLLIMQGARPGTPYNVCGGRAIRIGDLVDLFRSRAKVSISVEIDPTKVRPVDTPRVCGSHARLTQETGWMPRVTLEETVDDLLEWWRGQH
jgi:GDP-4-dehydro-6-deoxy-D-mannose reductase